MDNNNKPYTKGTHVIVEWESESLKKLFPRKCIIEKYNPLMSHTAEHYVVRKSDGTKGWIASIYEVSIDKQYYREKQLKKLLD